MAADNGTAEGTPPTSRPTRGKDQLNWGDAVWKMIDDAVNEQIIQSRMAAKFLPSVYVHKKRTTIDSDVVVYPDASSANQWLTVEESDSLRIQQFNTQVSLSRAQVEAEGEYDSEFQNQLTAKSSQASPSSGNATANRPHRASTAVSLALQAAKLMATADDLICHTGALAVAYHRLFTTGAIQYLDPKLFNNLDGGILGILPSTSKDTFQPLPTADSTAAVANVLLLDPSQIVIVLPKTPINPPPSPGPFYYENLLYGLAESIGRLQRRYYNDHYVNVSSTSVFSQYFVPLQGALQQPIEPASQLMTLGIFGTGNLCPYPALTAAGKLATTAAESLSTGLPTHIFKDPTKTTPGSQIIALSDPNSPLSGFPAGANVVYTSFVASLSGNSMDIVRGLMDDSLDVCMSLTTKSANEDFIFNLAQRFALRIKDKWARVVQIYTDTA
jgi:hypothetical protein